MSIHTDTSPSTKYIDADALRIEHEVGGISELEEELLEYRLEVMHLKARTTYLEAIESAARQYINRINTPNRNAGSRGFREAKADLVAALDSFEAIETEVWENVVEASRIKQGS